MADHPTFETHIRWTGEHVLPELSATSYTKAYELTPAGKPPILGSAPAAYGGESGRYNPEDLMLASLSSCHLLTFLAVAARAKVKVLAYEAGGTAALGLHEGKIRMVGATLTPHVRVGHAEDEAKLPALHEKAHANCFMSNSVNFAVTIQATSEVQA
jgi:organic hydroperoxide reductase OsmC/OhrA